MTMDRKAIEVFMESTSRKINRLESENKKLRAALISIACYDIPQGDQIEYWESNPRLAVAEVVAEDTRIARTALKNEHAPE